MTQARDIVVIGAALGGVTAIAKVAVGWPAGLQTSVLIALAAPEQPAAIVLQIIASYAPVAVAYATHGEVFKPRRIYLSPPNKHLLVGRGGTLLIDDGNAFDTERPSVNRLFASAAAIYGSRVIAIALSGNARDGAQGMRDIEDAGGIGIVQDPDDASAPTMPAYILRQNQPRYCVKATEIAPLVLKLVKGGR